MAPGSQPRDRRRPRARWRRRAPTGTKANFIQTRARSSAGAGSTSGRAIPAISRSRAPRIMASGSSRRSSSASGEPRIGSQRGCSPNSEHSNVFRAPPARRWPTRGALGRIVYLQAKSAILEGARAQARRVLELEEDAPRSMATSVGMTSTASRSTQRCSSSSFPTKGRARGSPRKRARHPRRRGRLKGAEIDLLARARPSSPSRAMIGIRRSSIAPTCARSSGPPSRRGRMRCWPSGARSPIPHLGSPTSTTTSPKRETKKTPSPSRWGSRSRSSTTASTRPARPRATPSDCHKT